MFRSVTLCYQDKYSNNATSLGSHSWLEDIHQFKDSQHNNEMQQDTQQKTEIVCNFFPVISQVWSPS